MVNRFMCSDLRFKSANSLADWMTGDRLAKELKAIKPNIRIIICTGFSERLDRKNANSMGVDGFLMKPLVKSDLANMVRNVLDKVMEK